MSQYHIEIDEAVENTSHAMILDLVGYNKRVLDIGCSTGYLAKVLTGRGCTVTGVEIDPEAAAQAAAHCDRVVVGSLDDLDLVTELGEAVYDVIVLGDVLEHLADPTAVLRRTGPLLRPRGSMVISVPNIAHASVRLSLLEGRFDYTDVGLLDRTHVHFFTRQSLQQMLRECGLVPVDMRRTTAPPGGTEIPVDVSRFPAELLRQLEDDRDASTYQFVCRAVVDDADSAADALAERMERAAEEIHELRVTVSRLTDALAARSAAATDREDSLAELENLRAEVASLQRLVAMRDEQLAAPRVLTRQLARSVKARLRR